MNITNKREDKKECIPDQTKNPLPENGMLDKVLSQMKSIMSKKGRRFSHDVKRQKKKYHT